MQQLQLASDLRSPCDLCAREILTGVPSVMRFIRHEMRQHRKAGLSVPQLRALVFLSLNSEPSLSAMAEHLGLSLPATSRMVELLVKRGLLERRARTSDRRSVSLSLTRRGRTTFRSALRATQVAMARRLETLSPRDLLLVERAMQILGRVFAPECCRTGLLR